MAIIGEVNWLSPGVVDQRVDGAVEPLERRVASRRILRCCPSSREGGSSNSVEVFRECRRRYLQDTKRERDTKVAEILITVLQMES